MIITCPWPKDEKEIKSKENLLKSHQVVCILVFALGLVWTGEASAKPLHGVTESPPKERTNQKRTKSLRPRKVNEFIIVRDVSRLLSIGWLAVPFLASSSSSRRNEAINNKQRVPRVNDPLSRSLCQTLHNHPSECLSLSVSLRRFPVPPSPQDGRTSRRNPFIHHRPNL